jgi:hypothetical protein
MRKVNLLVFVLFLAACVPAWADDIAAGDAIYYEDPATLHIGTGAGTPGATGAGLHPNPVSTTAVDVYQNSGGASLLGNPLLLILGIPNSTSNLFATDPIGSVVSYNPYSAYPANPVNGSSAFATAGTYGLISPTSAGYFGSWTSGELYSFLGLQGPTDMSNNFGNWFTADQNIGVTAANFGIYVFALTTALEGGGLVDIQFSQALPVGTAVVAYGQTPVWYDNQGRPRVTIYDTPITQAGQTTTVPEPGSLALLGSGLLGLAGMIRRKLSS